MTAPEQMSMPQLYDVIYHALALGDSTLQIWTSFTFAVIVAVHLAGDRIGRSTYILGSSLYALLSSVLILRYIADAYQILHYQKLLVERRFEPWPVPDILGILIGVGTFILMAGGTIGTLWFARSSRNETAKST
jgi:hypothetical protein